MLSIERQIEQGQLVCPISHQRLYRRGDSLHVADGKFTYPIVRGIPLLIDQERQSAYLAQLDNFMLRHYTQPDGRSALIRFFEKFSTLGGDYRNTQAEEAFHETIVKQPPEALCVSVGGGPTRIHANLINLNIGLFPNVDVVGDAYKLPYADNVVDAIHCEAVLEHLEYPDEAVREMFRVLRPAGQLFAATPFLQMFHGYPNHYQNFTLPGHERLFTRAGFSIRSAGVCVGPTYALMDLLANYFSYLPPRMVGKWLYRTWRMLSAGIRPLDRWINRNPQAHVLASTTYVHAVKIVSEV